MDWHKTSIKVLLTYMSALLLIMPFSYNNIFGATFEFDYEYTDISIYELPCYQYFFNNGYTTSLGGGVSSSNEYINYSISVTNKTTGAYIGEFGGYQQGSTSTAQMVCGIKENGQRDCGANYAISIGYNIPHIYYDNVNLNKPILTNIYNHNTSNSQYITVSNGNPYVFAFVFYNNSQMWAFPQLELEYKDFFANNGRVTYTMNSMSMYGSELCIIEFNTDDVYSYFDIKFTNWQGYRQSITPIYLGFKSAMTDDLYRYVYRSSPVQQVYDTGLNNTINNGNQNTQDLINNSSDINNNLNSTITQYDNIDSQFNNDFNTNLNAIDLSLNLNNIPKYLNASIWVSNQFNELVSYQPVRIMLELSLILGIALLLLGKRFNR